MSRRAAGPGRFLQIALDQTTVGLTDFGDRFASVEVLDVRYFQRFVRLAPANDR